MPTISSKARYSDGFMAKIAEELGKSPSDLTGGDVEAVIQNWRREKGEAGLEAHIRRWSSS